MVDTGFPFFSKRVLVLYMFWQTSGSFLSFSPLSPLTEVSLQPSAIPGGNPPGDWQLAVGWRDSGFEPGTAGQQSGMLLLSHHTYPLRHHACIEPPHLPIEPPRLPSLASTPANS
jgi:hypothetical protein